MPKRMCIALAGVVALLASALLALALVPPPVVGTEPAAPPVVTVTGPPGERASAGPHLVGISPVMAPADYATPAALRAKIAGYLETARAAGLLAPGSIVVLPEHLGTWLVARNAPGLVFRVPGAGLALTALALAEPAALWRALMRSHEEDRLAAALLRSRSENMAAAYDEVFGDLAQRYAVTIVAGSLVLENPVVVDGRLRTRPGPLYNTSVVFHPDGRADPRLVRKVYPIPSERPFTTAADVADLPTFDTPAGRLGVLICADSWYPETFAQLARQAVALVAVPSYLQPEGVWNRPWGGYVTRWAADADPADAGRLSEGEAWLRYGLAGRFAGSGAKAGINVFLKGDLWGLGSDGRTTAVWTGGRFVSQVEQATEIVALALEGVAPAAR